MPPVEPTAEQSDRLAQAVIAKATRFCVSVEAPLGTHGDLTEFGVVTVRPDYQIKELLYGLSYVDWDVDWSTLVTVDDVIRVGFQADPDAFPTDRIPDVERALGAAISWIVDYLKGVGVA